MEGKVPFEFLDHTADIKVKVNGKTLNEIFENSVKAISQYVSGNQRIASKKGKVIEVKGTDNESLLYNFIDEILYLIDAESFIPVKATVTMRGNNLKAELYGDSTKSYNLDHIKAATYAEMIIKKVNNNWEAIFVLDV
ncbi:MAG: archease [Nanoarchaeota archaeon]|nr:archease [Nanoarchaeota archaeon]